MLTSIITAYIYIYIYIYIYNIHGDHLFVLLCWNSENFSFRLYVISLQFRIHYETFFLYNYRTKMGIFMGYKGSQVSSGSIVSDYGLDDRAIGVRSPARAKDFSSNLCVQTGSGAHPASCTMGTGGPFPGGKSAAGALRWPLTPI
jgi:hypothetical protein